MSLNIRVSFLAVAACCVAFGQAPASEARPKFEAVDAHVSAKTPNAFVRTTSRGGRYQVKTATMVDLIRIAYGYDTDKILGGPSWLEMDRFDVTGKIPDESNAEQHKLMLQSALEDRFGLKVHKETKPLKSYALVKGKKVLMKEASGEEETGCKPQSAFGPRPEGGGFLMFSNANGQTQTFAMGPGNTLTYNCRNVTMASFVTALRGFFGVQLGPNPILEETSLEGRWNFDLRYSMNLMGPMTNNSDRVSIFDAVEKQLGLKLDERAVPMPVLIVDSVNRTPTPNPPEVAAALPPIPPPTEFEVASIKPIDPNPGTGPRMMMTRMEPGGRFVSNGMPLSFLISQAFNTSSSEEIVGVPGFASTDRYDIIAKAPGEAAVGPMDRDLLAPMLLNLLVDRFKLKYHREDRQVTAYNLVAAKPKMKKAEPGSRTSCKNENAPPGSPPGSRALICQNITMAQFAERLHNMSRELAWPVADETGIEGGWDLTLIYSAMGAGMRVAVGAPPPPPPPPGMAGGGAAGPAPGGEGAMANASDPIGGYTIFEAIEKQLGLKLEKTKRTGSVIVIDHMEQRPTEN